MLMLELQLGLVHLLVPMPKPEPLVMLVLIIMLIRQSMLGLELTYRLMAVLQLEQPELDQLLRLGPLSIKHPTLEQLDHLLLVLQLVPRHRQLRASD